MLAVWSERWRPAETWLGLLEEALRRSNASISRGSDFDSWELEVRAGILGAARVQMALEEHGGQKQMIRFRLWPRVEPFTALCAALLALLAVDAFRDGAVAAAFLLGAALAFVCWVVACGCAAALAQLEGASTRRPAMTLPANVRVGEGTVITGDHAFKRFLSRSSPGLTIGAHCTMDGTHFAVGEGGRIQIGDYCYFTNAVLLCELELRIGSYVVIGWNATIADSDFHPIAPADRIADAVACSPLAGGTAAAPDRPPNGRHRRRRLDRSQRHHPQGRAPGPWLLDRAGRAGRPRHPAGSPRGWQPRPALEDAAP
jgi:hypothetical protein